MTYPIATALGRKPVFTRLQAFQMLENRKLYGGTSATSEQFIDEMVASGEMARPCSRATMARLLNGSLFPDLCVFESDGKGGFVEGADRYDYSSVPRRPNGRPPKEENVRDDGSIRPKYTVSQKKMLDDFAQIAEKRAVNAGEYLIRTYLEKVWKQYEALRASHEALQISHEALQISHGALQAEVVALKAGRPA